MRAAHFHEYMRKGLFGQSINYNIQPVSMTVPRSFEAFASTRFWTKTI